MEIGSENWERVIREGAHQLGVVVPDAALRGLGVHAAEMVRFNRKMNLTTITDPFEIAAKHVIDSLAAGTYLPKTGTVLDIGSGGGFPGIPLKLVFPELNVTLIDGSARKVSFLKHVIRSLDINGIAACQIRAEQMGGDGWGRFDIALTRAVGSLEKCVRLSLPLINLKNGTIIALRGKVSQDDLAQIDQVLAQYRTSKRLDYHLTVRRFSLPWTNDPRTIVSVQFFC